MEIILPEVDEQRREAIETAIDRITEDILLDTVSGW
jgi:hypothetical protein